MKQVEVQILQQSYLLACPAGQEERLRAAVERVDGAMTRIREAGKVRARERIAVLAALNLAFDIADRETTAAAAITPAGQTPQPPPPWPASAEQRLQTLLQRLDRALGDDGRLL